MKSISVTINKERWKVEKLDDLSFVAKWGPDADGITKYDHNKKFRIISFPTSTFCKSTVVHEVTHAYLSYITLTGMGIGQVEERFCDLLGSKAHLIMRVSDTIYREFK